MRNVFWPLIYLPIIGTDYSSNEAELTGRGSIVLTKLTIVWSAFWNKTKPSNRWWITYYSHPLILVPAPPVMVHKNTVERQVIPQYCFVGVCSWWFGFLASCQNKTFALCISANYRYVEFVRLRIISTFEQQSSVHIPMTYMSWRRMGGFLTARRNRCHSRDLRLKQHFNIYKRETTEYF